MRIQVQTLGIVTVVGALLFTGCQKAQVAPSVAQEQQPNVTLTGTISAVGGKLFIVNSRNETTQLDSTVLQLTSYVGKKVSVTGQYSGTTLFVDTVQ